MSSTAANAGPGGIWAAQRDRKAYAVFDEIMAAHARTLLAHLGFISTQTAFPARAFLEDGPWMRPAPPGGVTIASLPTQDVVRVLDNACGNGVVTIQLRSALAPALRHRRIEYTCSDVNEAMIQRCKANLLEKGWTDVTVQREDAMVRCC